MKVNGEAFKKAREEIRKNTARIRGTAGEPQLGTQEWLAAKTGLSSRLIQRLEKGEASIETVDSVGAVLKINGRELIEGYGETYVHVQALGFINLRPAMSPRKYPEKFGYSALMLVVDPLTLICKDDDFSSYQLKTIKARLNFAQTCIEWEWAYRVLLVDSDDKDWLAIEEELNSRKLIAPTTLHIPIMFKQSKAVALSWADFLDQAQQTTDSLIKLEITAHFDNFHKTLNIGVSTELLKHYITQGKLKYDSPWPYYTQLKAMTWTN